MRLKSILMLLAFSSLFGCANPLNKETYYRYLQQGAEAERQANVQVAEVAYSRALGNVYMGNLGSEREAEALFNLGRLERLNGKLDLSLEHLEKSLELDTEVNKAGPNVLRSTLAEIAKTHLAKGDPSGGLPYLRKMQKFSGAAYTTPQSKRFTERLYRDYVAAFEAKGELEYAKEVSGFSVVE